MIKGENVDSSMMLMMMMTISTTGQVRKLSIGCMMMNLNNNSDNTQSRLGRRKEKILLRGNNHDAFNTTSHHIATQHPKTPAIDLCR